MLRFVYLLILILLSLGLIYCGEKLPSPTKIDSFRILSIKLTPASISDSGAEITAEALVVDENGLADDDAYLLWILSDTPNLQQKNEDSSPLAIAFGNAVKINIPQVNVANLFITLIASKKPFSPDDLSSDSADNALVSLVESDDVKIAIRTLYVQKQQNYTEVQNPLVSRFVLAYTDGNGKKSIDVFPNDIVKLSLIDDVVVSIEAMVDSEDIVSDAAWFSSAIDLQNRRDLHNKFVVSNSDYENLDKIPVWVVVRTDHNAQNWAGFFIEFR